MGKLSVVISSYNEEKKIEECLDSVKWADEIIVIENSSTDNTAKIARKYTKKVFERSNDPMLNVNKNFGFSKANNEWILSLDADERVAPELKKEIESVLNKKSIFNGYWIPRKNIIFGKWIQYTGWYPDHQLRLFKKGKGKFPEVHVHEMIELEGEKGYLKENIIHYNYDTIAQFLQKLFVIYAPNEAHVLLKNGYDFAFRDIIRFPLKEFLSRFFAREGYKDGFHGLVLSLLMAFYHLVVFLTIWEKKGFLEYKEGNMLSFIIEEQKKSREEISYWIKNERIKNSSGFFIKLLTRIGNKIR